MSADGTKLCVASTLTAEPLEESLQFWAKQFGLPLTLEFTPYNQVVQQLLDPASAFRQNRTGANVILLDLEEWLGAEEKKELLERWSQARQLIGGPTARVLPNGLQIQELNRHETDYVYKEIFEDACYLRHGIELRDGATVLDVGANIGLFSLFVLSNCRAPRLYAFEPSPPAYACLEVNLKVHGTPSQIKAFNCGISDRAKCAPFTFYEGASVFSSFHADNGEDEAALQAVVRNVLRHELASDAEPLEGDVQDLTRGKLHRRTCACELVSISEVIRAQGIQRVDLLKIDAEKSEFEILEGIEEVHWPMIEQLVIEVHDRTHASVKRVRDMLTRRGFQCAVTEEALLRNSGLVNVYARRIHDRSGTGAKHEPQDALRSQTHAFGAALTSFVGQAQTPLLVAIAPRTSRVGYHAPLQSRLEQAERQLLAHAAALPSVICVRSAASFPTPASRAYYDEHSHEIAHIPFTPEGYAAMGSALFRAVLPHLFPPFKVLVLDCDDTLWQGVCAEDGPEGVQLADGHRFLQELALQQMRSGLLVCLCSKNEEQDVWAVFDQRDDMLLRREHLAAWRINWQRKSDNLRALAHQLNLGLDSFVFIDDSAVECAEVREACPEVLVLQLPRGGEARRAFLQRLWVFDAAAPTETVPDRTGWYQTNATRESLQQAEPSLQRFLESLQVQIEVSEATDAQLARVAQLTIRTNQFNFTQIRRSEREIRAYLGDQHGRCLVAQVRDRLGDYGLVGAVLYVMEADQLKVDSFLLSCRALGKGVEHRMLAALARRAVDGKKTSIDVTLIPTPRNRPAQQFIHQIADTIPREENGHFVFKLTAAKFVDLVYQPDNAAGGEVRPQFHSPARRRNRNAVLSAVMQRIGDELYEPRHIVAAMRSATASGSTSRGSGGASLAEGVTGMLARVVAGVLDRDDVGLDDNFFELGGTSLKAVLVVARIRKELQREVTLVTLFECPTIRLMAARLTESTSQPSQAQSTTAAEARGRERRYPATRRKEILI